MFEADRLPAKPLSKCNQVLNANTNAWDFSHLWAKGAAIFLMRHTASKPESSPKVSSTDQSRSLSRRLRSPDPSDRGSELSGRVSRKLQPSLRRLDLAASVRSLSAFEASSDVVVTVFFTVFSNCPPRQNCSSARSQQALSLSQCICVYIPHLNPIYAPCPEDASHGILVRDTPPASNRFMCRFARGFPDASSWTSSASAARA